MARQVAHSFEMVEAQAVTGSRGQAIEGTPTAQAQGLPPTEEHDPNSDSYDLNEKFGCYISLLLIGVIVLCACMAESFHYVNFDEYALLQDVYGTVRLSKVYGEGRYFFPLNYDLLKFPSRYEPVKFDAVVFSETGLEFSVAIQFYYRLPKENLGDIYDSFSNNYNDRVVSNAQTTIKNVAAPLRLSEYLTNRTRVQQLFAQSVHEVLEENVRVDAPVNLFRIGEIALPETVIARSLESAIAIQNNEILANTQQVSVIRAETNTLVAATDAKKNEVINFAKNFAEVLVQDSKSFANQVGIKARGLGIATLLGALNFTSGEQTMAIVNRLAQIDNAHNTRFISATPISVEIQS